MTRIQSPLAHGSPTPTAAHTRDDLQTRRRRRGRWDCACGFLAGFGLLLALAGPAEADGPHVDLVWSSTDAGTIGPESTLTLDPADADGVNTATLDIRVTPGDTGISYAGVSLRFDASELSFVSASALCPMAAPGNSQYDNSCGEWELGEHFLLPLGETSPLSIPEPSGGVGWLYTFVAATLDLGPTPEDGPFTLARVVFALEGAVSDGSPDVEAGAYTPQDGFYDNNYPGVDLVPITTFGVASVRAPTPQIDVVPTDVEFGDVPVGATGMQMITIQNVGDAALAVDSVLFQGDPGDFSIASTTPALPTDLDPASSDPTDVVDVMIEFEPTTEGEATAMLQVASDDPDGTVVVTVHGRGVPFDEQAMDLLDSFDDAVAAGTLTGSGPGGSAEGRLNALRNMIEAAGDLIDDGLIDEACDQLLQAQRRTDGDSPPPDFASGNSAVQLYDDIGQLRANLGCDGAGAAAAAATVTATAASGSCGLGMELSLLLVPLWWLRPRRGPA